jgi:NADH-quinone oxidoreductase subunit C
MSSPTDRPVAADSAPEQRAADIQPVTAGPGESPDAPAPTAPGGMFGVTGSGDTTGFGGLARPQWTAPGAERPYGGYFDELVDALEIAYPQLSQAVSKVVVDRGELTLHVAREHLLDLAATLRNDPSLRFEFCASVSGTDYLGQDVARLHSVYHLVSMTFRRRLRLEVAVTAEDPHVPSVTGLYPTADWQERETFDLMGIVYDGHPGLTRIMMPDDWDGHPQRKDYPLGGIPVQYKGATIPPPDERREYR